MTLSTKTPLAPSQIAVEFLNPQGQPLNISDLGSEFMNANGIDLSVGNRPFQIAIEKRDSKAGNSFYEYSQNGVPFPDRLSTFIRVEGAIVPFGRIHPSHNGYPTREGTTQVIIGGVLYKVTVYLTEAKTPYFVKVIAHKKPESSGITKAQLSPRGGKIVLYSPSPDGKVPR
ncbi:hypothetical protein KKB54_01090 [bacterium]|nr:hypothetical protein [bacterium]MBU1153338.1 hypothetical protein [bacterium]MBU1782544.1 hypothetical protein [bacterium]